MQSITRLPGSCAAHLSDLRSSGMSARHSAVAMPAAACSASTVSTLPSGATRDACPASSPTTSTPGEQINMGQRHVRLQRECLNHSYLSRERLFQDLLIQRKAWFNALMKMQGGVQGHSPMQMIVVLQAQEVVLTPVHDIAARYCRAAGPDRQPSSCMLPD